MSRTNHIGGLEGRSRGAGRTDSQSLDSQLRKDHAWHGVTNLSDPTLKKGSLKVLGIHKGVRFGEAKGFTTSVLCKCLKFMSNTSLYCLLENFPSPPATSD